MNTAEIGNVLKMRSARSRKNGLGRGITIGELERPKLPRLERVKSLSHLLTDEKVASVFFDRFQETVERFLGRMTKAAGVEPAYSNPFAGRRSRHGYGRRGEHAPAYSNPYKWSERPNSKRAPLEGLQAKARAIRLYRQRERRRMLEQGSQAFGRMLGGGLAGAGVGGVAGGLLGIPAGPLGIAGGATLGAGIGGSVGALRRGGTELFAPQVMSEIGLPPVARR